MAQQIVFLRKLLEGLVFTTILVFIGGFGLFVCGELHKAVVQQEGAKKLTQLSALLNKIMPFPEKQFQFNFTHVLLFSGLVAVLSMLHHPAQDVIEQDAEKESKKAAKKEKKKEKEAKS
mmetsp:Transcript_37857/g.88505  ORF Transcript_37857/g.88505 Transcript_37857/m.88505 type:complete len:119 (+) Transcript_37857:86-442(+)